jgi:hypothetical protein
MRYRVRLYFLGWLGALACSGGDESLSPGPVLTIRGPADLSAGAISSGGIALTWVDNAANETQYEVWRSTAGSAGTYSRLAELGANSTGYLDSSLVAGKSYCYKVKATNPEGGAASPFAGPACAATPADATTGAIKVTTSTTGMNPDTDGYVIKLDSAMTRSLGVKDSVTFTGLTPGDHNLRLTGIAPNCGVDGQNPRTVPVTARQTQPLTFNVICGALSGTLQVTTATTTLGILNDPDGYQFTIDGAAAKDIGLNASVSVSDLSPGSHTVRLQGVAGNCSVNGSNPATVSIVGNATTQLPLAITCGNTLRQNQVLFLSTRGGPSTNLYLMNDDGSNVVRITDNNFTDQDIAVSPDGTTIVFSRIDQTGNFQLYRMRFDGSPATRISSNGGASDTDAEWSPDGSRLAFESDASGSPEVWLMDLGGGNRVQLTNNGGENGDVDWSPDGSKIVFEGHLNGNGDIFVVNTDGTGLTNLTNTSTGEGDPNWSPDGTMITFGSNRTGTSQVFVMNADGSNVRRVTQTTLTESHPAWGPGSDQLAFDSNRPGNFDVYKIDLDGSNVVQLTSNAAFDGDPEWTRPKASALLAARAASIVPRMAAAAAAQSQQIPACVATPGLPGCHRIPVIPDWQLKH